MEKIIVGKINIAELHSKNTTPFRKGMKVESNKKIIKRNKDKMRKELEKAMRGF